MPPTQQATSPQSPSHKWHILAATSLTLLAILLLASTTALCHLHRRKTRLQAVVNGHNRTHHHQTHTDHPQAAPEEETTTATTPTPTPTPNPHPFGTNPWRAHEQSQLPRPARDALRIADLEAQNNLLEQRAEVLEGLAGMLERQNGRLVRRMGSSGSGCEGEVDDDAAVLDPEVARLVHEELHRPVGRRAGGGAGAGAGRRAPDGFELQEVVGGRGSPLVEAGGGGVSFVGGPADGKGTHFSGKAGYDPLMSPAGRGVLVVADRHRDNPSSAGTSDAVIIGRSRGLTSDLEAEPGRSRSSSDFY